MRRWRRWTNPEGDIKVVKVGWSWPASLLTVPWLIHKRMWSALVLVLSLFVLVLVAIAVLEVNTLNPDKLDFLMYPYFVAMLIFGLKGNKWYERHLRQNFYNRSKVYTSRFPGQSADGADSAKTVPSIGLSEPGIDLKLETDTTGSTDPKKSGYPQTNTEGGIISLNPESIAALTSPNETSPATDDAPVGRLSELKRGGRNGVLNDIAAMVPGRRLGLRNIAAAFCLVAAVIITASLALQRPVEPVTELVNIDPTTKAVDGSDMTPAAQPRAANEETKPVLKLDTLAAAGFAGDSGAHFSYSSRLEPVDTVESVNELADQSSAIANTGPLPNNASTNGALPGDIFDPYTEDVGGLFFGVTDTLQTITDTSSAKAAIPHLTYVSAKAQDLVDILVYAPQSTRNNLKTTIEIHLPKLRLAAQNAATQPGVGSVIHPVVNTLALNLENIGSIVASRSQAFAL